MLAFIVAFLLLDARDGVAQASASGNPRRITIGVLETVEWKQNAANTGSIRGITLGLEEAAQTARLFGWEVLAVRPPDTLSGPDALAFLSRAGIAAVVGDLGGVVSQDRRGGAAPILLDIGRRREIMRCGDRRFYLLPTREGRGEESTRPLAWHPSLERFGAGELNERYRRRFGNGMNEQAWASWMAIKILVDAALKRGTAAPGDLELFLLGTARFDGHKGVPLYFHAQRRELVQPVFSIRRVGGDEEVAQIDPQPRNAADGVAGCQLQ